MFNLKTYIILSIVFHITIFSMPGIIFFNKQKKNIIKETRLAYIKIKEREKEIPVIKKISKHDNFKLEKIQAQEVEVSKSINKIQAEEIRDDMPSELRKQIKCSLEKPKAYPESCIDKDDIKEAFADKQALISYQNYIKSLIQQNKKYPAWAKRNGYEGSVVVGFSVTSRGYLENIKILQSSGYDIFDKEALRSINSIIPIKPLPEDFEQDIMNMVVRIVFKLGA